MANQGELEAASRGGAEEEEGEEGVGQAAVEEPMGQSGTVLCAAQVSTSGSLGGLFATGCNTP